mmetsp:Transcript_12032/g.10633  ORF Transcript_12032/g.10633 Transcript_12032/m.10633 type:complete len:109 (+) Transcript_12032:141-467(+)
MKKTPKKEGVYTLETLRDIVTAALFFCLASTLFLTSSRETLFAHTFTIANSGGVFIIITNIIRMIPVNRFEIIGTLVVIAGIFTLINDSNSTKANGETNIIKGDIYAL